MNEQLLFVSIIIPCRNEEKFIGKCLDSIINQDYPKDSLEVLVVDGMSEDRTKEIVKKYIEKYSFIKFFDNPKKFTPFGLNVGIKKAKGEIIMRMDAHAGYEKDYISKCVRYLKEYDADNIGGAINTVAKENTVMAQAITFVLSHPFGAGNSYFRTGSKEPKLVDTVFGGCYKKEVFEKIGLFNEKLFRCQDIEFNRRLKRAGGKILLVPDIVSYYYPKPDLYNFWKHNFEDGVWVTYPLKFGIRIFSWRHLLPLFFVSTIILCLIFSPFLWQFRLCFDLIFGSYLLANLFFSFKIAVRSGIRYFSILPVVFAARHFAYGLGSIWGLVKTVKK